MMITVHSADNVQVTLSDGTQYPIPYSFTKNKTAYESYIQSVVEMANRLTQKK